ncbi:GYD domain-containing protein [Chelatococcus sp. SYSU_G07232]|uniref:GYD domain-containing protein n=1 Tax=Chelatococcus albus TaxID=3047466 RepID=A0ABT7ACA9_9HYPH|nr:GYD domain-containing protein [Chelatococcus sp. SYSU_G07232]MDJ1157004.1 GYD domain-containing protein [Chelatococcus sp. SYSU_G07232]
MALYALQCAYAPVGWAALIKDPQNRLEAVRPVVERLGGSVVHGWLTFGPYDVLLVCELPDNVSAAALSMAISAGGAVRAIETTVLMTFDDGITALAKAKAAEYAPPPSEVPYFGVYRGHG